MNRQEEIKQLQTKLSEFKNDSNEIIKFLAAELFKEMDLVYDLEGTTGLKSINVVLYDNQPETLYIKNMLTKVELTTTI